MEREAVATRAATKATYPGMLDHVAAGQLADVGGDVQAQVLAELAEEAGVPDALGQRAAPASVVSYRGVAGEGKGERVTNEVLFCYDIELPASFTPRPVDGEVEGFELKAVDAVLADLVEGRFKPNVAVVTVDFMVRRGFLRPEMDGYLALVAALRAGDGVRAEIDGVHGASWGRGCTTHSGRVEFSFQESSQQ